jgi:phosphate acyltransferase
VRLALDALGGDRGPAEAVAGALSARRELDAEIVLVGDRRTVEAELQRQTEDTTSITVVHASDAIAMHEPPAQAVRAKRESSINVAMGLVKRGEAEAFVSAGSTGAIMASALLALGRIPGIERPALGALAPYTEKGVLVLDVGANADVKPGYMVQFAHMGALYAERVMRIDRPRVALLNIGGEATKGSEMVQDVYLRLQSAAGIHFVGNIEGGDVHLGRADVIVTDGFTGNVAVKVTEGVADFILGELRESIYSRLHYKLAALVLRPALRQMRTKMDPATYGGVPLLGVEGVVIIAHGASDARAVKNALRSAHGAVSSGMVESIRSALGRKSRSA